MLRGLTKSLGLSLCRSSPFSTFSVLSIPLHDGSRPMHFTRFSRDHLPRRACRKSQKISAPLFLSHDFHLLTSSKQRWRLNDSVEYGLQRSSIESSSLLYDSLSISCLRRWVIHRVETETAAAAAPSACLIFKKNNESVAFGSKI